MFIHNTVHSTQMGGSKSTHATQKMSRRAFPLQIKSKKHSTKRKPPLRRPSEGAHRYEPQMMNVESRLIYVEEVALGIPRP